MQNGLVIKRVFAPGSFDVCKCFSTLVWFCMLVASLSGATRAVAQDEPIRVATVDRPPFSMQRGTGHIGYSIELWAEVAKRLQRPIAVQSFEQFPDMLDAVRNGDADVAVANISATAERERSLDFSHPIFDSGLQTAVSTKPAGKRSIFSLIGSTGLLSVFGFASVVLLIVAHVIWLVERGGTQFDDRYFRGVWDGIWWAAVTVTSVGYGDKAPTTTTTRIIALVWMILGVFLLSLFVAATTQALVQDKIQGLISSEADLPLYQVATVENSTAHKYLDGRGIDALLYDDPEAMLEAVELGEADAAVFDAPVLSYYVSTQGKGKVRLVGEPFRTEYFAFAFASGSDLLEPVNQIILQLRDEGTLQDQHAQWFEQ